MILRRGWVLQKTLVVLLLCTPSVVGHGPFSAVLLDIPRGGAKRVGSSKVVPKKQPRHNAKQSSVETTGGASVPNEIFNLVKSIVGAGVLGLPAGT
jgi:hypothetical protein